MKKRRLGRTGLECSEIGLGTWALGSKVYGEVPCSEATRIIGEALDMGINFYDTAPLYGNKTEDGVAEVVLGKGLGDRRDDVVISSKFGRTATAVMPPRFTAQEARISCEASLRRIGREWIDLFFFHSPFAASEIDDGVWEELGKLRDEGKIRYLGHSVSMFDQTKDLCSSWMTDRKVDVIQVVLSPFNRETRSLIGKAIEEVCGVVARECMANGFLSGSIKKDTTFPEGSLNARYSREEIVERVEYADRLKAHLVGGEIQSLAQAAYRWVLDQEGVSLALSGARTKEELMDAIIASNASSFDAELSSQLEEMHQVDFSPA